MPNGGEEPEFGEGEEEIPNESREKPGLNKRALDYSRKRFGGKPGGGLGKGAGKTAGKAAGKATGKAAGKAAGTAAGAAAGTAVGGPLGTVLGALASKLVEKFGPGAIKWAFYGLLALFIVAATLAIAFWGILGGGDYFGSSSHAQSQQQTVDKFLGLVGDPIALRKAIAEEPEKIKKSLDDLKTQTKDQETLNLINSALEKLEKIKISDGSAREKGINELVSSLQKIAASFPGKAYIGGKGDFQKVLDRKPSDITKLEVQKREKKLYFYSGDNIVGWVPINIGEGNKGKNDPYGEGTTPGSGVTPKGTYKTASKKVCPSGCISGQFGSNMGPIIIQIKGPPGDPITGRGIFFHGGASDKQNRLYPTYGCVRVYNAHLALLVDYMENKTVVIN